MKSLSIALASLVNQFLSFPKNDRIVQTKYKFFLLGYMPNTIGVIDCTHVHLMRGSGSMSIERLSINIQLVGNTNLIITNCVVRWHGSFHDACILGENARYRELQTNRPDDIILGDSAYPLLPWLMSPFLAANIPEQAYFNTAHCKTKLIT